MDKLVISIVGAAAVALTSKLMHMIFLSGRSLSANSYVSRFFRHLVTAVNNFTSGWLQQSRKYKFAAYPCMLISMGLTSFGIYWLVPLMDETGSFWSKAKYIAILMFAGVMFSLLLSLGSLLSLYLLGAYLSAVKERRKSGGVTPEEKGKKESSPPARVPPAQPPPAEEKKAESDTGKPPEAAGEG